MIKGQKESRNHAVPETGKRDSRNQKACMFKGTKDSRKMADPGTGGTDFRNQKARSREQKIQGTRQFQGTEVQIPGTRRHV
jgi:hypothetical protein